MKIIGVTGGIGAGKSTVLNILEHEYHAYVIEADRLAQSLMKPGKSLYADVHQLLTDYMDSQGYSPAIKGQLTLHHGEFNRPFLAKLVFADPQLLKEMNALVHPAVKRYILQDIEKQDVPFYIIEAALLIEDGYDSICDELWYIYADEDTRIRRLMDSRQYSLEKCREIMSAQASDAYYRAHTRYVIDNSRGLETVRIQLESILKQ